MVMKRIFDVIWDQLIVWALASYLVEQGAVLPSWQIFGFMAVLALAGQILVSVPHGSH